MLAEILAITAISLFFVAFYKWATLNNDYFERRQMKYMKPTLFFGNTGGFLINKYTAMEFSQLLYQAFPNEQITGIFDFREPQYIIRDPEVIKQIVVKDFDHFEDHQGFANEDTDKLWGNSLFLMRGEKWRQMRSTLSPAFTGSKMRIMFDLVAECADEFINHFLKKADNNEKINIEMKDTFTRYTNDVIATCAYGLKVNSLDEPENDFYLNGKKLTDFLSFKQIMKAIVIMQAPSAAKALGIKFTDPKVAKTFKSMILDTMEIRKKNNIHRPDMINMLMQVREGTLIHQSQEEEKEKGFATVEESEIGKKTVNRVWNDDEIVAQCFIFFVGGFETTSSILTFASYELAVNQNAQEKLYNEIKETNEQLGGKRITYDALLQMKYLEQVICETLRKWPSIPQLDRLCAKDYSYDDGNEFKFNVETGRSIIIPVYGIQHDLKYFPDPEKFDPERFSDENRDTITPGTYIPFGVGPRNCIGSRFAMMVLKAALYNLLLNFSFEPNEKTQIPLELKKTPFTFVPKNGIHLELKPRTK